MIHISRRGSIDIKPFVVVLVSVVFYYCFLRCTERKNGSPINANAKKYMSQIVAVSQ